MFICCYVEQNGENKSRTYIALVDSLEYKKWLIDTNKVSRYLLIGAYMDNICNQNSAVLFNWLIISATLLGPILAVQAQKFLEGIREKKNRKLFIFHSLMATRSARVSDRHVEALNMIGLEYDDCKKRGKGKEVVTAWVDYLAHLNMTGLTEENEISHWAAKGNELFVNLLYAMSKYLKYDTAREQISKDSYSPNAHGEREVIQQTIARGLADLFLKKKSIPIEIVTQDQSKPASPE